MMTIPQPEPDHDLLLVRSRSFDPWHNLALEDLLLDRMNESVKENRQLSGILYLWQNQDTVVIGRNQNAWAECNTALLERENGRLARRTTGGGAVFHDLGNLNFSLIFPRKRFSLTDNFDLIVDTVASQGIDAERSGRNDVLAKGRKFSGNAFTHRGQAALHHGTLLIHSDYGRVSRYLTVNPQKLQAKGIASVRSRIINLQELAPGVTVDNLSEAMAELFCERFGGHLPKPAKIGHLDVQAFTETGEFARRREFFASWDWRYGRTFRFDATLAGRLDWGLVDIGLTVQDGKVRKAVIYSDALDGDFINRMEHNITGCRFLSQELATALLDTPGQNHDFGPSRRQMARDLADLFLEQNW
jgi:lipoate-protein ligase A